MAAPLRGLQILNASRIAVVLGESIQILGRVGVGTQSHPSSNRVGCQTEVGWNGLELRAIALRIVTNLRTHATMATLCGLPAAISRV